MKLVNYILKIVFPKAQVFERNTKDPFRLQQKLLFNIIRRNKKTVYGKKYKLSKIKSIPDYQRRVPVADYNSLKPYINKMKKGETDILTSDKTNFFAVSSGTTSRKKFIPVTYNSYKKERAVMNLWIYYVARDHPDAFPGKILVVVSPEVEGYTSCGIPFGAESGHTYRNVPGFIKKIYALPYEVFTIKDYDTRYYCILRLALEIDLTILSTVNPSTLVLLADKVEAMQDDLIRDIEQGSLKKGLKIPPGIRKILEKRLKPNPRRARELRAILKKKKRLLPKDIWPKLKVIICWKSGSVGIYLNRFPEYFGNIPVRDFGYLASEFRGSIPVSDKKKGGVLAVNANFYEFIPKDQITRDDREILLCDQLKLNKEYYVLVTTPGGLYRYSIGDIIRVNRFFNKTPVIEFVQRGLSVSSLTGEKLHESQVVKAVKRSAKSLKLPIMFFTASPASGKTFRYSFVVEFAKDTTLRRKKDFLKSVDRQLCRINGLYELKRKSQMLSHPVLKVVKREGLNNTACKR